jgi:hypothetical protein
MYTLSLNIWGRDMAPKQQKTYTADQVDIVVLKSEKQIQATWDTRMDHLKEAIDVRFTNHEKRIDTKLDTFLVRLESGRKDWEKGLGERLDSQDVTIADTNSKVTVLIPEVKTVVDDVQHIRHRMRLLGWIIMASKGAIVAAKAVTVTARKGKEMHATIAMIFSALFALMYFFHTVLPSLRHWIAHHG